MTLATIEPYDGRRAESVGGRGVVVGGSIAGLAAARVLADSFDEVVVLDRDPVPDEPTVRDGAPQTSQPHVMLEAGRVTLEDLFPGFSDDVRSAGGLRLDMTRDFSWYDQGGTVLAAEADLTALYASRPLFEHVVREHTRELDTVRLRGNCYFFDYEHDADGERITGVRFRDESGTKTSLDASLVVDATGRNSPTPMWLRKQGYPEPGTDRVEVDVTYSSARIARPPEITTGSVVTPEADQPWGAAMLPIEHGQWQVILQGIHGARAPDDRESFVERVASLPVDDIAARVREHEWLSEIQRYPFTASIRHRYERLDRFPDGLIVTGDAIASFNPIYGQGMSVAALDALVLHHELADGVDGLGPRFFRRAADVVGEAWKLAVGRDFVFDRTTGPKPFGADVLNSYVSRLVRQAHEDGDLTEAFFRVFRLERPVTSLLRPDVAWRVLRPRL